MIEKSESNQLSLATAPIPGQAPSKTEKVLITNKVITSFSISLCTPISYLSFSRSTAVSRFNRVIVQTIALIQILRVAEIIKYPKTAQDFGSDSRRGKGRIVVLCNLFHNAEAGPKDKQDWIIIFFRGPNTSYPGISNM